MPFFATSIVAQLGEPRLDWWTPEAHITRRQRCAKTASQILAMGPAKWGEYYYRHPHGENMKDGSTVVWAWAEKQVTDRALRHAAPRTRSVMGYLRVHLMRFGMACIGLEDTLAGGGTYASHFPQQMWAELESDIKDLVEHRDVKPLDTITRHRLLERLYRYQTIVHLPDRILADSPPDATEVHGYGKIRANEDRRIRRYVVDLNPRFLNQVERFEESWLIGYLGIRGADGTDPFHGHE